MMQAAKMIINNNPWPIQNSAWPFSAFISSEANRYIP